MSDIGLAILVLGVIAIALTVDVAVVCAWLTRQQAVYLTRRVNVDTRLRIASR